MRILLALVSAALLTSPVCAQALVELGFSGEESIVGGGSVECSIVFRTTKEARGHARLDLNVHVAEHTSAADLAGLLSKRLLEAGAHVLPPGGHSPPLGPANLFIEEVESVALRLGHGLECSVTLCEDRPASIRILPPSDTKLAATLTVVASTIHPYTREHARFAVELGLEEKQITSELATNLSKALIDKGWLAEIESHDTCRPSTFADGSELQGCSFALKSKGDWRIEIALAPRPDRR